eukprot:750673-Hanusia_phi.AAC.1
MTETAGALPRRHLPAAGRAQGGRGREQEQLRLEWREELERRTGRQCGGGGGGDGFHCCLSIPSRLSSSRTCRHEAGERQREKKDRAGDEEDVRQVKPGRWFPGRGGGEEC